MTNASEPLLRHLEGITGRKGLIRPGEKKVTPAYWRRERKLRLLKNQRLHTESSFFERGRSACVKVYETASKGARYETIFVNLGTPFIVP